MVNVQKQINEINSTTYKGIFGMSVSTCLDMLKLEFNSKSASIIVKRKNFNNIDSPYYHMNTDEIIAKWKEKADTSKYYGNKLDEYVGLFIEGDQQKITEWKKQYHFDEDERLRCNITGFEQFWNIVTNVLGYHYVAREMTLFVTSQDEGNIVQGRFDCLFYNPETDKYMIVDWKTNEKITTENKYNRLLGPCFKMQQTDLNRYTMQVFLYKKAFIETYQICDEDQIDTFICKLELKSNDTGNYFTLMKPAFDYETTFLDKIINFTKKTFQEREEEKKKEKEEKEKAKKKVDDEESNED